MQYDPTGEFGLPGMAAGAGLEIAMQLATNGNRWKCIDWADVAISPAIGAVAPGWLSVGKKVNRTAKAIETLAGQRANARTAARAAKLDQRMDAHRAGLGDEIATQGAWQGLKGLFKKIEDAVDQPESPADSCPIDECAQ